MGGAVGALVVSGFEGICDDPRGCGTRRDYAYSIGLGAALGTVVGELATRGRDVWRTLWSRPAPPE